MIEVARRKAAKDGAEIDFQVGLIEDLPFADDRFDRVLSAFMLHHLPEDVKREGLVEIRRVLKPDGRLLIVDFGSQSHSLRGHVLGSFFGHGAHHDAQALPQMLREAGFADVELLETEHRQLAFVRAGRQQISRQTP